MHYATLCCLSSASQCSLRHGLIVSMNFTLGDRFHWVAVAQALVTVVPRYSDGKDSEEIKLKLQVTHLLMENALRLSD